MGRDCRDWAFFRTQALSIMSRLILLPIFLLLDAYAFQAIRTVFGGSPAFPWLVGVFWGFTALVLLGIVFSLFVDRHRWPKAVMQFFPPVFIILSLAKLIIVVFLAADDVLRLVRLLVGEPEPERWVGMSIAGLIAGGIPAVLLIYGMLRNVYRYQVRDVSLVFRRTPEALKGLRIVQLSDIHAGSLGRPDKVAAAVEQVNAMNPDLILFTGDLVNLVAEEAEPYVPIFARLRAKHGVFSITGNHDYGDYVSWTKPEQKAENFRRFVDLHKRMGWRLLRNENTILQINGADLALIGVENWSAHGRFSKYGDLAKAYVGADQAPVQILLSHDPSHWKAEVLPQFPDIDVQLAGHTHGFQFGLEIGNWRWSPGQYVYREWAGLYEAAERYLYVNRGFGYTFYPGRVGMRPEITVLTLA